MVRSQLEPVGASSAPSASHLLWVTPGAVSQGSVRESSGSQSVAPEPATAAAAEYLLETQTI